jgi:hypothetical protein
VAEEILEQDLERVRKAGDVVPLLERVEPEDLVIPPAGGERRARAEAVRAVPHPAQRIADAQSGAPRRIGRSVRGPVLACRVTTGR